MIDLPAQVAAMLGPGEDVLWSEQPRPSVFIARGVTAIFYGTVWSVLGAFWYHGAAMAPWMGWWKLVPIFSLPFIAAGWSFFFYPINLGVRARHTWYVVTNRRVFIARLHRRGAPEMRVFTREETGTPHVVKRLDRLYEVILSRNAQGKPYLVPRLESGFFGIRDGQAAAAAVETCLGIPPTATVPTV